MPENPLKIIETIDPELFRAVDSAREFAFADGALPRKYKVLIALALDAAHGSVPGVTSLANTALRAGATREEITEALRVTDYICGVGSVYTAAHALKDIF